MKTYKPFFATLRGKRYKIVFTNLTKIDADCDHPSSKHKTIRSDSKVKNPYHLLELAIHEGLHACFFDLDEDSVNQAANDITKLAHKVLNLKIK